MRHFEPLTEHPLIKNSFFFLLNHNIYLVLYTLFYYINTKSDSILCVEYGKVILKYLLDYGTERIEIDDFPPEILLTY